MKNNLPEYYVNSDVKITAPFYTVTCLKCKKSYWAVTPIKKCALCGSDKIKQFPANKKNPKNEEDNT